MSRSGHCRRRWPMPRRLHPAASSMRLAVRQPAGVVACITSYNFPLVNMAGKGGSSARNGQHGRREARPPGSAGGGRAGAHPRRGRLPPRGRQPGREPGARRGRPPDRVTGRRHDQLHGIDSDRSADRRNRCEDDEAHAARARGQGGVPRARRRRREGRDRLHRFHLVVPFGTDLHRTHAGDRPQKPFRSGRRWPHQVRGSAESG